MHVYKKLTENKINVTKVNGNLYRTLIMHRNMKFCNNIDCMTCKIAAMSTCFNLPILSTKKCSYMQTVKTFEPTDVSKKATLTKKKAWPNSKTEWVLKEVKQEKSVNDVSLKNVEESCNTKPAGPNKDWVPNAT